MTHRSAFITTRLAAAIAAAGFFFVGAAAAQTNLPPPQQYGSADARQDRIQELEQALRDATAENERLQNDIIQRDREIQRLRNMVGELAGVNQQLSAPPADGQTPAASPPSSPRADAGPSGLSAAQQANTGSLGSIPAASVSAPPPAPTADELYNRAQANLNAGRYAEAEIDFAAFLEAYPNVTQTANARFWYAYTLLARNNYRDAADSFVQYLRRAPQAPRAAEAQVRLGMALIGLGERQQGCAAITSLAESYPNASAAVRELAAREARVARCAT
jgi:tol-pal system protein YbgF